MKLIMGISMNNQDKVNESRSKLHNICRDRTYGCDYEYNLFRQIMRSYFIDSDRNEGVLPTNLRMVHINKIKEYLYPLIKNNYEYEVQTCSFYAHFYIHSVNNSFLETYRPFIRS